ncbi:glycosyltransferase family 2 protein [Geodermatophilus sp. SYSU D00758]
MNGPAQVTVVIPTHNRRRLVLRTLDSVVHQQDVDLHVVVVVDGGTDGTADAVRTRSLGSVEVVEHTPARGVSAARNTGLARADTPWVAFVDDDDLWAPGKLRAQLDALGRSPGAGWSCGSAVHLDAKLCIRATDEAPASGDVSHLLLERQPIPGGGSGVLVDTALARRVGGFDERISILADWDFYLRLSLESPLAAVDEYLVGYYVHQDSMFHDPRGILRELHYMREKYPAGDGGRPFRVDPAAWYVALARMAYRSGDRREAANFLGRGLVGMGVRGTARKARGALRRRRGEVPNDGRGVPRPAWLSRYADADG